MKNYFDIFNLPISFQIDIKILTERFYNLQKKYHPDFHIYEDKKTKINIINKSIKINHAYQVLIDPIKRAEYLIYLNNLILKKEKNNKYNLDFLKKHIKLCEELEILKRSSNKSEKKIRFFLKKIDNLILYYLNKIEKKIINKDWIIASKILEKLFFLKRIKCSTIEEIKYLNK
ncbi:Co-chaperone protein HscB [Buchnera aphidicola (Tetraneura ulmi)]|uniref:Fe-S protein assembly co-chaperone HscB n=1 Tax=Buchnera aphidicola TaxID=9 RepID=UPI0034645677